MLIVYRMCSCKRSSTSHQEVQGSQDALTHLVIPRSTLPLLHGQLKPLGCIFCEERRHLAGKRCTEDRDIDFIVADQAQAVKIARSDRRPLFVDGAGLRVQHGIAVAKNTNATL